MKLDAWMTKPELGRKIVQWAQIKPTDHVLEPSAGIGSFAEPIAEITPHLTCVELHPGRAQGLREHFALMPDRAVPTSDPEMTQIVRPRVICREFVGWSETQTPGAFDVAITNPPYSDDQDMDHVLASLRLAKRVVALLRLTFLAGIERRERLYSRFSLSRLVVFSARPSFIDASALDETKGGGPRHDFVLIELTHGSPPQSGPGLEWW